MVRIVLFDGLATTALVETSEFLERMLVLMSLESSCGRVLTLIEVSVPNNDVTIIEGIVSFPVV